MANVSIRFKNGFNKDGKPDVGGRVHSVTEEQAKIYIEKGLAVKVDPSGKQERSSMSGKYGADS